MKIKMLGSSKKVTRNLGVQAIRQDRRHDATGIHLLNNSWVRKDGEEKQGTQALFEIIRKLFSYFAFFFSLLVLALGDFCDTKWGQNVTSLSKDGGSQGCFPKLGKGPPP